MTQQQAHYLIGIDLGTTNTVVAYADMQRPLTADNCQIFEIEQLVAAGEVAKRPMLPSFRYHPAKGEINQADMVLPWSDTLAGEIDQVVIGEWARELGHKVGGRQVVSAKSWLSHPQVDRTADILPWAGAEDVAKVSPLLASSSYLFYVRNAWNVAHPDNPMEHQQVVITVPASFDENARSLTVEAAKRAGLAKILLLEEPQAVCYDWYARHETQAKTVLANTRLLLVCDVGGGTTDLSLIKISYDKANQLALTRVGVGNHLMLGGDNVDLTLAHKVEQDFAKGTAKIKKLSVARLSQLIQQTRKAKELLLGNNAPESTKVTLLGSGSSLIGGSKSVQLSQQEVRAIALEGFFPLIDFTARPQSRRSAVVEFGLPYAPDPAVSKYIAEFIADHQAACKEALELDNTSEDSAAIPDAVLFNGGVFNSPIICQRTLQLLTQWRSTNVQMLENSNPDLAVAKGAVAYAKARQGAQLKIGGGSARSFFLVLEQTDAVKQAICLLPKGTEEDQELQLHEQGFLLTLGQPVQFHLLSTAADDVYALGEIIAVDEQALASQKFISLPPLVAVLQHEQQTTVSVSLASSLTEVGTLQIDCVADNQQRWHLEFEIRKQLSNNNNVSVTSNLPAGFDRARDSIENLYGDRRKDADPKAIKTMKKDLERELGNRDQWDGPVLRSLADTLLELQKRRRRTAAHERSWFNFTGYGLRPGFGYPLDDWRIEQVWRLYTQGLQFNTEVQVWVDWWTFWRRVAGGLNADQQLTLYEDVAKYLQLSALSNRKLQAEAKLKSYENMVKLVAALEHLPVDIKLALTKQLLKRLEKPSETISSWWAIGRITSRVPFYGSIHNVIAKEDVQHWLPQLLKLDWKKKPQTAFAVVLMVRMSGDRSRDIDADWRQKVIAKLTVSKAPTSWVTMVETVKELNEDETKKIFGEGLPAGLTLIQ